MQPHKAQHQHVVRFKKRKQKSVNAAFSFILQSTNCKNFYGACMEFGHKIDRFWSICTITSYSLFLLSMTTFLFFAFDFSMNRKNDSTCRLKFNSLQNERCQVRTLDVLFDAKEPSNMNHMFSFHSVLRITGFSYGFGHLVGFESISLTIV